jgi:DNA-directed RNA polymerase specialized sigma24 family protein
MIVNSGPILQAEINIARNLAKRLSSKWSLVEFVDLESVLVLWLYENQDTVIRYRSEVDGTMKLITALRRRANSFCTAEQQERSGTPLDYYSSYSIPQIERSLTAMFNSSSSHGLKVDPNTGSPLEEWDPSLDDAKTAVLDVKLAFRKLDVEMQKILIWKYEQEYTYRDIALLENISAPGARKRVRRALRQIQMILDGKS